MTNINKLFMMDLDTIVTHNEYINHVSNYLTFMRAMF